MYNEVVISHIGKYKYLSSLKNSNVSIISKKNKYNDVVKFFAQINTEDVVQRISFKATGCSHFMVFCNYFCSVVEGQSVKNAIKISKEDLLKFADIDESKIHVIEIILQTFQLLVKKYRKGVDKGTIQPCDIVIESSSLTKQTKNIVKTESSENVKIKKSKKSEEIQIVEKNEVGIDASAQVDEVVLFENNVPKDKNLKEKKVDKTIINSSETKVQEKNRKSSKAKATEQKVVNNRDQDVENKEVEPKKLSKTTIHKDRKENLKVSDNSEVLVEISDNQEIVSGSSNDSLQSTSVAIVENHANNNDYVVLHTRTARRITTKTTKTTPEGEEIVLFEEHSDEITQSENSANHTNNLKAFQAILSKNSANNHQKQTVSNLSMMLNKIQSSDTSTQTSSDYSGIKSGLSAIHKEKTQTQSKENDEVEIIEPKEEKKKKGLFSWFKKK